MLRMTLIASLVLFNLSVWMGPVEVLAARGKALIDPGPRYERAQDYVIKLKFGEAAQEYLALLEKEPDNLLYHTELGLLYYNNAEQLRAELGWDHTRAMAGTVKHMKAARDLSPGDYSASAQYALTLMDDEFFGTALPVEVPVEAWKHTLAIVTQDRSSTPTWEMHYASAAHIYLQLARVHKRYGQKDDVAHYVEQVLTERPNFRIPQDLLE